MSNAGFDVLIPVGPDARELQRLNELLEALFHYESEARPGILLVNDGNSRPALEGLLKAREPSFEAIIDNPRKGAGEPSWDGLSVGVLAGFSHLAANRPDSPFVLKVDTDTLIINSFSEAVASFFGRDSQVGLVGTYLYEPGSRRKTNSIEAWQSWVRKLERRFDLWRRPNGWHFQNALWGRGRTARRIVRRARSHGYEYGASCIGGGYALRREALQQMKTARYLDNPCLFLHRHISEDVAIGLLVSAVGMKIADFNSPNEPFGVVWRGLSAPPAQLLQDGYSIIHSVKDYEDVCEAAVREFFSVVRTEQNTRSYVVTK